MGLVLASESAEGSSEALMAVLDASFLGLLDGEA